MRGSDGKSLSFEQAVERLASPYAVETIRFDPGDDKEAVMAAVTVWRQVELSFHNEATCLAVHWEQRAFGEGLAQQDEDKCLDALQCAVETMKPPDGYAQLSRDQFEQYRSTLVGWVVAMRAAGHRLPYVAKAIRGRAGGPDVS